MKVRKSIILLTMAVVLLVCAVGTVAAVDPVAPTPAPAAGPTVVIGVPTSEVEVGVVTQIPVTIENSIPFSTFAAGVKIDQPGVEIAINDSEDQPLSGSYEINPDRTGPYQYIAFARTRDITATNPTLFFIDVKVTANNVLEVPLVVEFTQMYNTDEVDLHQQLSYEPAVLHVVKNSVPSNIIITAPPYDVPLVYKDTGIATATVYDQYDTEMTIPVKWTSSSPSLSINEVSGEFNVVNGKDASARITASIDNLSNYTEVQIEKADLSIDNLTFDPAKPWNFEYDGQQHTVNVSIKDIEGEGVGTVTTSYFDQGDKYVKPPTAKGTYYVKVTLENSYYYKDCSLDLGLLNITGKKIPVPELVQATFTYDGQEHVVATTQSEFSQYYTLTADTKATNAGTYTAKATLTNPDSTVWERDGEIITGDFELPWTILPKEVIDGVVIEFNAESYSYTGSTVTPVITVKDGSTILAEVDYTLSGDTKNATVGNHTVTITGRGNYNGTLNAVWEIKPATPTKDDFVTPTFPVEHVYDGMEHTVDVSLADTVFGMGDFEIRYLGKDDVNVPNPIAADNYEVIVDIADGTNYTAQAIFLGYMNITPKSMDDVSILIVPESRYYTGNVVKTTVTAFDDEDPLWTNDYEVTGDAENATAGDHIVTVTGKNNYTTGQKTATWTLLKADPTAAAFNVIYPAGKNSAEYTGEPFVVNVEQNATIVGLGSFEKIFTSETDVAVPELIEKGNYKIYVDVEEGLNYNATQAGNNLFLGWFNITSRQVAKPEISANLTYNGAEQQVPIVLETDDYKITGETAGTAAGVYTVTVSLKNDESTAWNDGTVTPFNLGWEILNKSIAGAKVNFSGATYTYDGNVITPTFTIEDGELVLDANDFIVPENLANATAGDHAVTFIGQNNYTGTVNGTWTLAKAVPTLANISLPESVDVDYDGQKHNITGFGPADGVYGLGAITPLYNGSATEPNLPGLYLVNLSVAEGLNYTVAEFATELNLTINELPPVEPDLPPISKDEESGNVTVNTGDDGAVAIDEEQRVIVVDGGEVNLTIIFDQPQTDLTQLNGTVAEGNAVAEYKENDATFGADEGVAKFQLNITLKDPTKPLPAIIAEIKKEVKKAVKDYKGMNLTLATMITADAADLGEVNDNVYGEGIELTFFIPKGWAEKILNNGGSLYKFHKKEGSVEFAVMEMIARSELISVDDNYYKIIVKGHDFSSYGIAGKETPEPVPPAPSSGGGGSSGSSTWLTPTPTPTATATPTATPTDTQPTDTAPTVQPTSGQPTKPAGTPVPIAGLILGGLAAAAILRRK